MRHWIKADNAIMLVAISAEQALLGYCLGFKRRNSHTLRLYSLATASAARGTGIGRQLLTEAERQARALGCNCLRLEVAENNQVALALYAKQGYQQFGFVPDFYEDGQNAVRMEKILK